MKGMLVFIFTILIGLLSVNQAGAAPLVPLPGTDRSCLRCHSQAMDWNQWANSAHYKAGLICTDCHKGADKAGHSVADVKKPACTSCHYYWKVKAAEFKDSVHAKNKVKCGSCHNPHTANKMAPENKNAFVAKCAKCHKGNPLGFHAFMPHADMHLQQHSCTVCHSDVHGIGSMKDNTVTCSNCHPGKSMVAKVLPIHKKLFPRIELHMKKLRCEQCHRPYGQGKASGPIDTCVTCHSPKSLLGNGTTKAWIENNNLRKKYGYMIGANHIEWLDILGILMFAGALGVWFFHGGLRILASKMRKGRKHDES